MELDAGTQSDAYASTAESVAAKTPPASNSVPRKQGRIFRWLLVSGLGLTLVLAAIYIYGDRLVEKALTETKAPKVVGVEKAVLFHRPTGGIPDWCIPLVDPRWVPGSNAPLMRPDDPVIGIRLGEHFWALQWWVMKNHHVANLILDGRPILVTLCERCSSASAYDPVIDGKRYIFRVVGFYNGTIMTIDLQTYSWWSGVAGEALEGPMKGKEMTRLPAVQCRWKEWVHDHPTTLVLEGLDEPRDGHGADDSPGEHRDWKDGNKVLAPDTMLNSLDQRIPVHTLVLGVQVNKKSRCYPLKDLPADSRALNDTLSEEPIVVLYKPGTWMAVAFRRTLDGKTLTFKTIGDEIVDENTGSHWDMAGQAASGPLKGRELPFARSGTEEFYMWGAFHTGTEIYGRDSQAAMTTN